MYHIVQCGHSAACVRLLIILENSVYIDASLCRKNESGRERDRDGRTQKERKVSECNIDCPSAIINQHRRRQSYLFFCLCLVPLWEKVFLCSVCVYFMACIILPSIFRHFFIYLKRGRHQKISWNRTRLCPAWKTEWMSPSSLLQHFQNSRFQIRDNPLKHERWAFLWEWEIFTLTYTYAR